MKCLRPPLAAVLLSLCPAIAAVLAQSATPNAQAEDARSGPLKDLNGYFPFVPPRSLSEWDVRKEEVRRRILVAEGLWPMPTKTPLNPVIHGRIDRGDYVVEKVYFESAPGFYVTGNLYRPTHPMGKVPGILFAHGHWKDARLSDNTPAKVRQEIAEGQERFEKGGRSRFQSLCVQLARMGCVVWQWDMLSDSDSIQFSSSVIHSFAKQRPEMNTTDNWGLYSPQAEAHAQSVMGLQTWNAVRGLDFLLSLPEVDPERTAITGASGGGTQTMLLAAIDERIKLSFPVVMVSTAMQGGCTCENASLLRIDTGNIEFAALFAPKPQGMNTANDWTKELATKGFPELQSLYTLFGKKDSVLLHRGEHFPHNYNAVTRSAFYTLLNKEFKLGWPAPVIEQDFEPLSREQLTVWDDSHPAPKAASPDFERTLLKWFHADSQSQLLRAAATPKGRGDLLQPAIETLIGRTFAAAGAVNWTPGSKTDRGSHLELAGSLENLSYRETLPALWLYPKAWKGQAVAWLDGGGTRSLRNASGTLLPAVQELLDAGVLVVGADLFSPDADPGAPTRKVANPREFAGYTFGYNHSLFAQRTHDVLTLLSFLKNSSIGGHPKPSSVSLAAWGAAGPVAAAARALAGSALSRAAIDTGGFRFGSLLDFRHPQFLPGGAKYLDVPGLLSAAGPGALWLAGEGDAEGLIRETYQSAGAIKQLNPYQGNPEQAQSHAVRWLLQPL
jgi:dienelactone hydrolase